MHYSIIFQVIISILTASLGFFLRSLITEIKNLSESMRNLDTRLAVVIERSYNHKESIKLLTKRVNICEKDIEHIKTVQKECPAKRTFNTKVR